MHRGDGHVTLLMASGVIYGMLFTNTVCYIRFVCSKQHTIDNTRG